MVLELLIISIAALWLCHRATRLLKLPASQLITTLGIEIPDVPNITLDAITCTSVLFHWVPPEKNVVKYVFQLDGKKALSTSVSSKSASRNSKTRNNDAGEDSAALAVADLDDNPSKPKQNKNKLEKSIYTVKSLEKEVELIQSELQEVLTQKSKLDLEYSNSEQVAQSELELAKSKRKTDELSRAQLKTESKSLEETKHSLDTQRAKIEKANKLLSSDLERKTNEKNKWVEDIESARLKIAKLDISIEEITNNGLDEVLVAQKELKELQALTAELDEKTKELASSTKKTDSLKSSSLQALIKAKGKTDKLTGIINDSYVIKLLDSPDVHPKLKEAMKSELEYETQLEEDWKKTQKDLETRYLKVHVLYSDAKKAHEKSVEMHKPPPSDSNPVYEAVAAAAAAAAGNSNAGNFPANPAEAQCHPIAPTTSNPPSDISSAEGTSPHNTKSRFSKGFANFFSSSGPSDSTKSASSLEHLKPEEEVVEHDGSANNVSDSAISIGTSNSKDPPLVPLPLPKETILQKSIRTFSLPRKSNHNNNSNNNNNNHNNNIINTGNEGNSGNSNAGHPTHPVTQPKSKFTMRRLSMFSKKGASSKESEEEMEMPEHSATPAVETVAENSGTNEDETMDYQEFLAQAERQFR